jgi:hypothetical protein
MHRALRNSRHDIEEHPLKPNELSRAAGRALKRAAQRARETARMHGTPVYFSKNGKVVALKP